MFLAHDPVLERRVALKLLHRDPTSAGLRNEAKALAALSHPGIVTIYEIGEHDGQDFIAMEYLPGRSLRQLLGAGDQGGARSWSRSAARSPLPSRPPTARASSTVTSSPRTSSSPTPAG